MLTAIFSWRLNFEGSWENSCLLCWQDISPVGMNILEGGLWSVGHEVMVDWRSEIMDLGLSLPVPSDSPDNGGGVTLELGLSGRLLGCTFFILVALSDVITLITLDALGADEIPNSSCVLVKFLLLPSIDKPGHAVSIHHRKRKARVIV